MVQENGKEMELKVRYDGAAEESVRLVIIDSNTIETAAPEDLNGFVLRMKRVD